MEDSERPMVLWLKNHTNFEPNLKWSVLNGTTEELEMDDWYCVDALQMTVDTAVVVRIKPDNSRTHNKGLDIL